MQKTLGFSSIIPVLILGDNPKIWVFRYFQILFCLMKRRHTLFSFKLIIKKVFFIINRFFPLAPCSSARSYSKLGSLGPEIKIIKDTEIR